ncbi:MAG: UvrD-helicase domain-containing protein [Planctomycetes bacterium]|nr:UvrD-helicase domain-containing protein [Planctomycetota bacterium]
MTTPPAFDVATTPLPAGRALIEASAGTGKTYTIAGLFVRLVAEQGVKVSRILVVTFTEAATAELKMRIRTALGAALAACEAADGPDAEPDDPLLRSLRSGDRRSHAQRLRAALRGFDEASVATIHGFCKRVLDRAALQSGAPFQVEFVTDDEPLLRGAVEDFWRRTFVGGPPELAKWAVAAELTPNALLSLYRELRRDADARIEPAAPDLATAVAALTQTTPAVGSTFDRARLERLLAEVRWNKDGVLEHRDTGAILDEVSSLLAAGRLTAVAEAMSAPALERVISKRGKAGNIAVAALAEEPFCVACTQAVAARDALHGAVRRALLESVDVDFALAKERATVLTFDDLLRRLRSALDDGPRGERLAATLRSQYEAVLVDEFQDTDPIQWGIFERAFGAGRLYLIGDPKQAIYAFRGADLHTYLRARDTATDRFTLDANYRSRPGLLDALNVLFGQPRPFLADGLGYHAVRAGLGDRADRLRDERPGSVHFLCVQPRDADVGRTRDGRPKPPPIDAVRDAIVRTIVTEIQRLLAHARLRTRDGEGEQPLRAGDIGILTRTNAQAAELRDALAAVGIGAAVGKGREVFQTDEMEELVRVAAAIAAPRDRLAQRAAYTTLIWGDDLAALRRLDAADGELDERIAFLDDCRRAWLRHGFVRAAGLVFDRCGTRARLAGLQGGARRLTNLLHAVELLHRLGEERDLSPAALVAAAADLEEQRGLDSSERELRLDTDRDAVQIVTVHRAKGLQYPVVFCPYLWEGSDPPRNKFVVFRWHDDDGTLRVFVKEPGVDTGALQSATELHRLERFEERLRLAYVALTRAEQRVYVAIGAARGSEDSALAWLLRPPGEAAAGRSELTKQAADQWDRHRSPVQCVRALLERAGDAAGAFSLREVTMPVEAAAPRAAGATPGAERWRLQAAPAAAARLAPWRLTSFSGMLRGAQDATRVVDHDDPAAPTPAEVTPLGPAGGMLAFARGAEAGICLHAILERIDLRAPDAPAIERIVGEELARAGLADPRRHAASIEPATVASTLVRTLARAPLPGAFGTGSDGRGRRLCELPPGRAVAEWRFCLQLASSGGPELASALRAGPADGFGARYAESLRGLPAENVSARLRGYLSGSIDLLCAFEDDRHWVIDWKSNHLGESLDAHRGSALEPAMFEHHYVLQYHLYLLALHRHLRDRLADYDYERHVGGACYVFLRGVGADGGGMFVDRPPRAVIEALDAFAGRAPGARP